MSEGGGSSQISTSEHQESRYQPQNANQSSINHHNYHAERNGSVVGMKDQQDRERKESGLQRRLSKIPRPFARKRLQCFPRNPRSLEVELDQPSESGPTPIYRAGQMLRGNVKFTLTEPIHYKRILVKLHGLAKVWWLEGTGDQRREYQNLDTYFHDVIVLSHAETDEDASEVLPEGNHSYLFQYALPTNLPCSVERVGAYIRYSVKAIIDRSWAALNPSCKKYFTVIDDVNLNEIQNVLISSSYYKNKRLLRGLCGAGSLRLVAFTDRYGYCPGETIYITVSCHNQSPFTIRKVIISMQQLVMYTSSTGHRKCQWNCLLSAHKRGCCSRGGVFRVIHLPLHIPSIPMSCNQNKCRCISTSYSIKIKFRVRKGLSYTIDLPIIIGSIPINIFASIKHGIIHPRPTHLECVMKGGSIEEDDDDVTTTQSSAMGEAEQLSSFTPAYTYYDWRGNYPKPEELPYPITGMKLLMLDN
ncbi:arrestin domain-containing protein 3-like isoform X2 [Convolutriloba macropyga]|uniref:arrestin domain-containing protein 3-like isoform X2 n=1 Tax=Convolutriloba macropyga TaxID=536237 RepID=UPI003F523678